MTKRIMLRIDRSPMEKTTVAVMPWERPILEEIHGSVLDVTIAEVLDMRSPSKIEQLKLKNDKNPGWTMAEQTENMLRVDPELDPVHDLETEWARLEAVYGRHPRIDMSVVEKVFGSLQQFKMYVKQLGSGADIELAPRDDEPGDLTIAEMTAAQMRARLKSMGIEAPKSASRDALAELLLEKEAA